MSLKSLELPQGVGVKDRVALTRLRLKRLRARAWMREQGIAQIGSKATAATRLKDQI